MKMMDFRDNLQKCQEYINALEEERKKIHVFQRELPLCLELVTGAIEACKQQLSGATVTTECINGHSECSEQTTSNGPVYEEFIPIKRSNSTDEEDDDDEEELESNKPQINNNLIDKSEKNSDWLRSVQLWNQTSDPPTPQEEKHEPKKVAVVEVKRSGNGGAFHPFQKEKNIIVSEDGNNNTDHHHQHHDPNNNNNNNNDDDNMIISKNKKQSTSTGTASASSSAHDEDMGPSSGGSKKEDKAGQSQRKARRCWSPELHRRFVNALQQLGGSHVATPKQIRDLMKVDGLTNDEVKSHLQKYRLHTRRPNSSVHNNNASTQAPQFVVVGGIWMPPREYSAVDASTTAAAPKSIYTPIAAVGTPPAHQTSTMVTTYKQQQNQSSQSHCEERASRSEARVRSNSPSTSSSTHTTTSSHAH